ncbi:T9SS type A sorting domain-containing protein [Chryseobacterium arthrosphaerae]|uniref:T9SS type A sorting domain-containing protein n=1 Tax=Chryseobacterium arthrosphaerae TaxID=651561 RepID=A0A432DUS4_9FLAO|nr:T9SS type A sorting domain-containing protein [Chryseobacterium arthrosphaerae]
MKEAVASISLFSVDGRKLAENYRESRIDLSSYTPGVYFLNIVLKGGITFKHKIIKK